MLLTHFNLLYGTTILKDTKNLLVACINVKVEDGQAVEEVKEEVLVQDEDEVEKIEEEEEVKVQEKNMADISKLLLPAEVPNSDEEN